MMAPRIATFAKALLIIEGGATAWNDPKTLQICEKRSILEADCDLQNGQIPSVKFPSPSSILKARAASNIDFFYF